jgi:CHRD domain-containing protein
VEEEMMKITLARLLTVVGLLALVTTAAASADESALHMRASLSGFNEVPPKATLGSGTFKATASGGKIVFTLTYSGLTTPAFMAHYHFAQRGVNGGIFIWLCGLPGTPAKRTCPDGTTAPATVTGTITAADIVSILTPPFTGDQGVNAGDMSTALRIIQSGNAYVNVHTSRFPGGEIRGQVSTGESGSD